MFGIFRRFFGERRNETPRAYARGIDVRINFIVIIFPLRIVFGEAGVGITERTPE